MSCDLLPNINQSSFVFVFVNFCIPEMYCFITGARLLNNSISCSASADTLISKLKGGTKMMGEEDEDYNKTYFREMMKFLKTSPKYPL